VGAIHIYLFSLIFPVREYFMHAKIFFPRNLSKFVKIFVLFLCARNYNDTNYTLLYENFRVCRFLEHISREEDSFSREKNFMVKKLSRFENNP